MPTIFQRKVLKIGDSIGVTVPIDIIRTYNIKQGDVINIVSDAHDEPGLLLIDLKGRTKEEIWKLLKTYN